jgi:hypothetical protein
MSQAEAGPGAVRQMVLRRFSAPPLTKPRAGATPQPRAAEASH